MQAERTALLHSGEPAQRPGHACDGERCGAAETRARRHSSNPSCSSMPCSCASRVKIIATATGCAPRLQYGTQRRLQLPRGHRRNSPAFHCQSAEHICAPPNLWSPNSGCTVRGQHPMPRSPCTHRGVEWTSMARAINVLRCRPCRHPTGGAPTQRNPPIRCTVRTQSPRTNYRLPTLNTLLRSRPSTGISMRIHLPQPAPRRGARLSTWARLRLPACGTFALNMPRLDEIASYGRM
ncbi:hypothetical protein FA95DRAFT_533211 [Auriscalpium vulgare]|uniref:Uncharacterized protein n=1 Tax=Auriscalpium vulgare TaxID=40419 RepID=A0ACB8RGP2_9AGAM|nr:hypothetical protein FA95DRAFT_533211 [Auriscalpium vulgare]